MYEAIVIGAGPGGIAAAACLREAGVDAVLLERGDDIATRWRSGYDRLRLNTSSWFSHLPGRRFPRQAGRWVARDDLVAYFQEYAALNRLTVLTRTDAERLEQTADGWRVLTSRGSLCAEVVVVATGKQHTAAVPDWPGLQAFNGELIHSSDYRSAQPFRGKDVLVVGSGNSGTDIAVDLAAQAGVGEVWLAVRRPPHILRREFWGIPHDAFGVVGRRAPRRLVDASARLLRRLTVGDLGDVGLPVPADGAVTRFEQDGRVPTIDTGEFVQAVCHGRITIVSAVERLEGGVVRFADRALIEPEAIVAATGYRPNLDSLVGHLDLLDSEGIPIVHGGTAHPSAPHLYFAGFVDPRSGHLRELRLQARQIAQTVARAGLANNTRAVRASPQ